VSNYVSLSLLAVLSSLYVAGESNATLDRQTAEVVEAMAQRLIPLTQVALDVVSE